LVLYEVNHVILFPFLRFVSFQHVRIQSLLPRRRKKYQNPHNVGSVGNLVVSFHLHNDLLDGLRHISIPSRIGWQADEEVLDNLGNASFESFLDFICGDNSSIQA